jgi:hypothetical protein
MVLIQSCRRRQTYRRTQFFQHNAILPAEAILPVALPPKQLAESRTELDDLKHRDIRMGWASRCLGIAPFQIRLENLTNFLSDFNYKETS